MGDEGNDAWDADEDDAPIQLKDNVNEPIDDVVVDNKGEALGAVDEADTRVSDVFQPQDNHAIRDVVENELWQM
jgi:hypothetical protein